mmetsp:Transcript_10767/g.32390  ORF Transcript_10767/g.32390 Transcript_10767/m.32390 type:complete len:392 (+) Transcript_10767:216-1391(+)
MDARLTGTTLPGTKARPHGRKPAPNASETREARGRNRRLGWTRSAGGAYLPSVDCCVLGDADVVEAHNVPAVLGLLAASLQVLLRVPLDLEEAPWHVRQPLRHLYVALQGVVPDGPEAADHEEARQDLKPELASLDQQALRRGRVVEQLLVVADGFGDSHLQVARALFPGNERQLICGGDPPIIRTGPACGVLGNEATQLKGQTAENGEADNHNALTPLAGLEEDVPLLRCFGNEQAVKLCQAITTYHRNRTQGVHRHGKHLAEASVRRRRHGDADDQQHTQRRQVVPDVDPRWPPASADHSCVADIDVAKLPGVPRGQDADGAHEAEREECLPLGRVRVVDHLADGLRPVVVVGRKGLPQVVAPRRREEELVDADDRGAQEAQEAACGAD